MNIPMAAQKIVVPTSVTSNTILQLKGIGKKFGDIRVLEDVDFQMSTGEVVAIIGPSGSGKSTLLRCINQLEPPTEGTITVGDVTIDACVKPSRAILAKLNKKFGMVFQSFNLFPHLTVLENVSLAQRRVLGRSKAEADGRSMELLARVGLASKSGLYPSRCSGGQQQRIAISRALALDPEIMLFDVYAY